MSDSLQYYFYKDYPVLLVQDKEETFIPYHPYLFTRILIKLLEPNTSLIIHITKMTYIKYEPHKVYVKISDPTYLWQLFDNIRNVKKLKYVNMRRHVTLPHYMWAENIKRIDLYTGGDMGKEIFYKLSGKFHNVLYETWMDVKTYDNIIYECNNLDILDKNTKKVRTNCPDISILQEFSNLNYLGWFPSEFNIDMLKNINCRVIRTTNVNEVLQLNKFPVIISCNECEKEILDANNTIIDGLFPIKGMCMCNSKKYLRTIFKRNRHHKN